MPTAALRQITAKQDNQALRARLEAEAARVQISYKASVIDFMVMEGIQDFSELDYATRKSFEAYLEGQSGMKHIRHHLLAFDKLKQHALSQEFHILEDGKVARPRYENGTSTCHTIQTQRFRPCSEIPQGKTSMSGIFPEMPRRG